MNGQQSLKTQVAAGPNTWQPVPEATAGHSLLGLTVPEPQLATVGEVDFMNDGIDLKIEGTSL